jgi:hypothetical protein
MTCTPLQFTDYSLQIVRVSLGIQAAFLLFQ